MAGVMLALLAAFSWGGAIVMSKSSLDDLNAGALFFFQIVSAALLCWGVLLATRRRLPVNRKSLLAYGTGVFEPFLAYTLALYGLEKVPAGIASIIFSLESALIIILSVAIFRIKIHSPWMFALFFTGAMVGALLAILPGIESGGGVWSGYLLVFIGVLSAAFYVVVSSRLVASFDPITLLTGQLTFSVILSGLFLLITGTSALLPSGTLLMVASSGILQYFLAFFFYLHALKLIQVHIAGVMLYFIPVIALILSWLFMGEVVSTIQAGGIALALCSMFFLNRKYGHE